MNTLSCKPSFYSSDFVVDVSDDDDRQADSEEEEEEDEDEEDEEDDGADITMGVIVDQV